ncbi:imidazolonepropionase [Priestia filamentosa]|nr:imidazolonepropionase [Priestia filamentosa]
MTKPIWIKHATQLATLAGEGKGPRSQEAMSELGLIEDGSLWIENGIIQAVGTTNELEKRYAEKLHTADIVEASNHLVTPGLVDPHTHVVYGGSREREFEMRLEGATYMDIMNAGGGIHATARMTREAIEEELLEQTMSRLDSFLAHGVTMVESKSGYGMNLETELKQLRVMKELQQKHAIDLIPTFMGAHAVPPEFKGKEDEFVDYLIDKMLPIVAEENLAEFNDVFCEKGVFTPEQSKRILEAGKEYGLVPKIHADEIEPYGGAELAAKVGAISAEHLLKASDEGIHAMAKAGTIACLLPATALYLREEAAAGRKMIDAGVPVAISTDCIQVVTLKQARRKGLINTIQEALERLSAKVDLVYVTVDMDVLDISIAPGVPASTPGGMTSTELFDSLLEIGKHPIVQHIDFVCLDPSKDSPVAETVKVGVYAWLQFITGYILRSR